MNLIQVGLQRNQKSFLHDVLSSSIKILILTSSSSHFQITFLQAVASQFIDSNFFAVSRTNDFLSITKQWLLDIVTSNNIVTEYPASDGEYQIYEAVRRWVNHDLENRKKDISEVM